MKFHKNLSCGSRGIPYGTTYRQTGRQTDRHRIA